MLFLGLFIYTALQIQMKIYLFSKVLIARRQSTQVLLGIPFIRLQRITGFATVTENFKPRNKQKMSQKTGDDS